MSLKIYNILGDEVAMLVSEKLADGKYKYNWDAIGLAGSVYLYQLKAGNFTGNKNFFCLSSSGKRSLKCVQ